MWTRSDTATDPKDQKQQQHLQKGTTIKFNAQRFVSQQLPRAQVGGKSLLEEYAIGDMLGSGGFGEVYLGCHKKTGAERAIKVVNKNPFAEDDQQAVLHEFNIVRKLDHPNILKMYNLYQDESCFYIVTDIYKGGELFDEIIKRTTFTESDAAELMTSLLSCINYLHQNGIVHRDLKPENILLEENMEMDDMKVIDYGLAAHIPMQPDGTEGKLQDSVGTIYYMSPQVLENEYDSKTDIWSAGVICYVLLAGFPPFDGETDADIEKSILRGDVRFKRGGIWDTVSDSAIDFVNELLTYESEDRPTAERALDHPWLASSRQRVSNTFRKRASDSTRSYLKNLKDFNATSKLKQATCAFIASQLLLKNEKDEIDEVFRALDTNCDGKLTRAEVRNGYYEYYGKDLTKEELDTMFQQINYAGTGAISYSEFVIAAMFQKNLLDDSKLQAAFAMFDSDGDGVISADNFKSVLSFFKEETDSNDDENIDAYILEKVIKQVDADGDGKISYADFQEMMFRTVAVEDPPATVDNPLVAKPPSPINNNGTDKSTTTTTATTPTPEVPKRSGHRRQKSVVDVGGAASVMNVFADAVSRDSTSAAPNSKRHRRNHSHLSHFANQNSSNVKSVQTTPPTHRKNAETMSALPNILEIKFTG